MTRFLSTLCLTCLGLLVWTGLSGCTPEQPGADEEEMKRLFEEARKLDEKGDHHEAMTVYESILAKHPNSMAAHFNAGMSAYDSAQYPKALGHFEMLYKYSPKDWFIIRKLIQCYERLERPDKVDYYRKKLEELRTKQDGAEVLKTFQGFTRDYVPVGSMHLIGYEFFDPKKSGKLWFFKLEDAYRRPISSFLLEASPFHLNNGRRMFYLTESSNGWMRIWYAGENGRDYAWTRTLVLEVLSGKRTPLACKPLPPGTQAFEEPGQENVPLPGDNPPEKKKK